MKSISKYKLFHSTLLLYVLCFVLFYCRLSINYQFYGDDVAYVNYTQLYRLFDYLAYRYSTWTSRIFVEMFLYILSSLPVSVWKLFLSLSIIGGGIGFSYLIGAKTLLQKSMVFMSIITLPNVYWGNTGWLVTTVAYMFFAFLSVLMLCSIRDLLNRVPISVPKLIAYIVGTILAANVEQCCLILGICFSGAILYFYFYQKRVPYILFIQLICLLFDVVLFLMSSGNRFRFHYEIGVWWEGFAGLSFSMKLLLGFRRLGDIIFFDYYIFCLIFGLITALFIGSYYVHHKKRYLWLWLSSCVFSVFILAVRPENMAPFNQYINLGWIYIGPFALLVYCIVAMFSFWRRNFQFYLYVTILWMGLLSSVILGFSPTLYASHARIFIFFIYVLLFLLLRYYVQYGHRIPYFTIGMWIFNVFWILNGLRIGFF